jgi:hypothetical protein
VERDPIWGIRRRGAHWSGWVMVRNSAVGEARWRHRQEVAGVEGEVGEQHLGGVKLTSRSVGSGSDRRKPTPVAARDEEEGGGRRP